MTVNGWEERAERSAFSIRSPGNRVNTSATVSRTGRFAIVRFRLDMLRIASNRPQGFEGQALVPRRTFF